MGRAGTSTRLINIESGPKVLTGLCPSFRCLQYTLEHRSVFVKITYRIEKSITLHSAMQSTPLLMG